jgi:quinol monooxygenase YgiN
MKRTYDSSIHCQAIISKEVSPIEVKKIYLLAELTILPGFLEEVKAILKEALIPTLQEPGCKALYETGRKDDPHSLVFFEVFSSTADMSSTSNRTIQSGR